MKSSDKKSVTPDLPTVEQIEKIANADQEQWIKLLITGGARLPFGSSESYDTHPLREYFDKHRFGGTGEPIHLELFTLCAEKIGLIERAITGEYISLRDVIIDEMDLYISPRMSELLPEPTIEWYLAKLFEEIQECVAYALQGVAEKVACGAPIYRINHMSGETSMVADNDQPSAFLIGKRLHRDVSRHISGLPAWVQGHAFKNSDLDALKLFYGDSALELTDEQISARRVGFRSHLGIDYSSHTKIQTSLISSKLMDALQEVRTRYYGPNFSIADQQTWPKQKDVVEWLKTSLNLSEREASAVDIVARPDALRGK
ncbi:MULTISPECIES: hypothetical protein [Delftia]|nr:MULTISPECIES: hypothetical protein [Delftia]MDH0851076.1 hypothetical protein [Delftia tsuruhatensis]WEM00118.1 hypothetical protein PW274_07470 [Delftia tsuruhatensis]WQM81781.1 hypothetical protein RNT40_24195 [Delftia tsuruhatensis]